MGPFFFSSSITSPFPVGTSKHCVLDLTHKYVVKMTCKKQDAMELHRRSWIYVVFCAFSRASDKQRITWFFILFKDVIIFQACFIRNGY